jgi:hypothetical protein
MRKLALVTLLAAPLCASAATNLISNGSFESGLSGWTVTGSVGDIYPVGVISYNSATAYPTGAFGEAVPVVNAASSSLSATGASALYFVSDFSSEVVSQQVIVSTSGAYTFGFDLYLPANGFANDVDATLGINLGGTSVGSYALSSLAPTTWLANSSAVNLAAGTYTVSFAFSSNGKPAKDVVLDNVYLISSVPEASSSAMLLAGLAGIGFMALRRKNQR